MAQQASTQTAAGGGYKWLVLAITSIGTFIAALDGSVVNIVIPQIQRQYNTTIGGVSWISTIYLLVISALLLSVGRMGDMWGFRKLYASGFFLFGLSSILCGLAPALGWLILARAMQGFGAAVLWAIASALISTTFPGSERGRALGLQATMTYIGVTAGPSLGGWISERFGWHWVFLINVPVTAVLGVLVLALLRVTGERSRQRFDVAGAGLFGAGLAAMLLGLSLGESWGWGSAGVRGLLVGAALLLILFVWQEGRAVQPMMPLWLFRNPAFAGGVATALLQYAVIFAIIFLLPFYLGGRGLSPAQVGLVMTAQPGMMMVLTAVAGWLSDRVGPKLPATVGLFVIGLGVWLVSRAGAEVGLAGLMLRLGVVGLGSGLFTAPNNSAILGAAPRDRQGVASGLLQAARNVGTIAGVAGASALYAQARDRLLAGGATQSAALTGAFAHAMTVGAGVAVAATAISLLRPRSHTA